MLQIRVEKQDILDILVEIYQHIKPGISICESVEILQRVCRKVVVCRLFPELFFNNVSNCLNKLVTC